MSLMGLFVFTSCISSISVHDETDMFWNVSLFEYVDKELLHAVELNHFSFILKLIYWVRSINIDEC